MKKQLLLAAMSIASVFTAKAQTEFSGSVDAYPNTDWTPANVVYDLGTVAEALGYADAAAFAADLSAAVTGGTHDVVISNIDNNGTESTTNTANYWRWMNDEWQYVTYGCFWLNSNCEVVEWSNGNMFWSQVNWDDEAGQLLIGLGQMAYENGGTGLAPGSSWTANTKLTRGTQTVILHSTLNVIAPPPLPDAVTTISELTIVEEVTIEVSQQIMTDWNSELNPQWSVSAKSLIDATGVEADALSSNMGLVFFTTQWDTSADMLSTTLTNESTANGGGFWMKQSADSETGEMTDYCVHSEWGLGPDFFVENIGFRASDSTFYGGSGQMINKFKGGEHFYTDFYFVIGDKATHVVFHFNVETEKEYKPEDMSRVGEMTMVWTQMPRTTSEGLKKWLPTPDDICDLLGCSATNVHYKILQPDDVLVSGPNHNGTGFWIDESGYVATLEEGALGFYVDYAADKMALTVGQNPGAVFAGDELMANLWLCNGEKYFAVTVILSVEEGTPAPVEDYHEVGSYSYSLQTLIDNTWDVTQQTTEPLDMDEVTTLLGTEDFVVYAKSEGSFVKTYTCTPYPGFWFTADGTRVVGWSDAVCGFVFERDYVQAFKNPNQADVTVGQSFLHQLYLVNEKTGAYITLNVNVVFVNEIVNYTTVGTAEISLYINPDVDYGFAQEFFYAEDMYELLNTDADTFWQEGSILSPIGSGIFALVDPYAGMDEFYFDADGNGLSLSSDVYSIDLSFEPQEGNDVLVTGTFIDYDPEDTSLQMRTTTLAFQMGSLRYLLTVHLYYDQANAIVGVKEKEAASSDSAIYDLTGRKVQSSSLPKGIYIIGGNKVFVK